MTTKPKASRFHIRRTDPVPPPRAPQVTGEMLFDNHQDGFGDTVFPTATPRAVPAAQTGTVSVTKVPRVDPEVEATLAAIAAEGLTGRQLRTARRMAQSQNLQPMSDLDAVRLLRAAGIDPFKRASMLDMIKPKAATPPPPAANDTANDTAPNPAGSRALTALPGDGVRLPQNVQPIRLPTPDQRAEVNQAAEILRMQQDIARRRRRKLALLCARMFVFVLLPTIVAGWYYYRVATPLYATKSEFVIQQAGPAAAAGFSSLFSGTALATSQDSIAVQGYLQSRDAMLRLDSDVGFKDHFKSPAIDPLQRLAADATTEAAYKVYKKFVKIAYDPTEGIIKMEVVAADPALAAAWSSQLISYAEEQVDHLTQRLREDQMRDALKSYGTAEQELQQSQMNLIALQEKFKMLSSATEVAMITGQISTLEGQLMQDRLALAQMESNASPNQARMDPVKRRVTTLEAQIADLRAQMTEGSAETESLARVQGELLVAEADVKTRQMILAQSLTAMEVSRTEANRQVRYLSLSVSPTVTDEPAYPRAFENTLVTMLIMLGIYLMVSMTAAILREQVSA
ncbi:MAG: capsule biosynthesis protein [Tabrizicola sp.]|uniref:capsule biosynthesis protein n=1 Tax=Tabrizicola sp. TaxID=2005166 RepID=UPI002734CF6D|nr:capsule biosynthesis protein [Tabrizicola sp.]MDP3263182.1 capsule biosynthesis protein [Tabrizicola sp.]MDP3646539.1 capsule biosynthesis protein [Paracoccaceae bacterium]MDZ4069490.1 capsule biosynthesis protein [Tabrizicola sp.]